MNGANSMSVPAMNSEEHQSQSFMRRHLVQQVSLSSACLLLWAAMATAPAIDEAAFAKLHHQLQPPQDEAWRGLPWQDSILKAKALAATQEKPVYMLVRSGHPLGCV